MRRYIAGMLAVVSLAVTPMLAWSGSCGHRVVAVKKVVAVQAVVAVPVVAAVAVIPTYSVAYDSGSAALIEEIRKLRLDVQNLRGGAAAQPPEAATYAQMLNARCASCHQDGKEASGGGQVLIEKDGKPSVVSLAERKAILRAVAEGRMPPKSPISDQEKKAFAAELSKKE